MMVQKYVWFDDVQMTQMVRTELRLPKPLREFVDQVAKRHDVSVNAFLTGLIAYAADVDAHRRLKIEVIPSVRVREIRQGDKAVDVPVQSVPNGPRPRKRKHGV